MMQFDLWRHLDESAKKSIQAVTQKRTYRRAEVIYRQGDEPEGLFFIEKGLVGLVLLGESSGKEHLVRFFKAGQFFGHRTLFANEIHHATSTALETTHVSFIPKMPFLKMAEENPCFYKDIVEVLAKELRAAEVRHVNIMENQVLARTAQALVYLKELYPEHLWTRQEIANFCASTTSTVIKAMAILEERRLISQHGRSFDLLDRENLINLEE